MPGARAGAITKTSISVAMAGIPSGTTAWAGKMIEANVRLRPPRLGLFCSLSTLI